MSEAGPSGPQEPATPDTAAQLSEVATLISELRNRKSEFDALVASSSKSVSEEVEKVRTAVSSVASLENDAATKKGEVDEERTAVADLVAQVKASQKAIDDIKIAAATAKGAVEAAQTSASENLGVIIRSKAEIETLGAAANELSGKLKKEHEEVAAQISELQSQQVSLKNILEELSKSRRTAEEDANATGEALKQIEQAKDRFTTLNSETGHQYDALVEKQGALLSMYSEIDDAHNKVTEFRRRLLDSSDEAKSVQDEIGDLRAQIADTLKEVSDNRDDATVKLTELTEKLVRDGEVSAAMLDEKFKSLYDSLKARIEALLPSAGAAGLSSTYYDAKSRYSPTSYGGKLGRVPLTGWRKLLRSSFGNNPASLVATISFYTMFIVPLGVVAWGSYLLLLKIEDGHFTVSWEMLAVRVLIAVPLISISTFGFASLRLYRKLFEEYNHKQRVMELYQSFVGEIAKNGDEEQKKKLLTIMLDSVADKAWKDSKNGSEASEETVFSHLDKFANIIARVKAVAS